jgi:DNA/RNA-binding domain of Phe-tRNA-synthetase-like protein
MSDSQVEIEVESHPLLRPVAFTTDFPRPLGEITTPSWIEELLDLDTEAPVRRDEALRLAVRDMLRHWGHKPAGRGKPASEYLVRAVGEGALGLINAAVDVCNVVSLHCGMPIALVDLDRAHAPFTISPGLEGERYIFNPAGQEMDLRGLICLRDAEGPCGNPVKDAQRVKTDEETTRTLTVLWGVAGYEEQRDEAVRWYREMLGQLGADTEGVTVNPRA